MPSLSETFARLAAAAHPHALPPRRASLDGLSADRLSDVTNFGADPGNLRARAFLPQSLPAHAPLVVVLHGCTQSAAAYDQGSGWSTLADRHGFALLYPEQRAGNNPNRCFNWFATGDITRDQGEAASIRHMIAHMIATHDLDPARVFVTGLSAGGAMAMAMLATYPEVFAGGAVIAGLPYGTATSVGDALQRMRGSGLPAASVLADRVRRAAPPPVRWPLLSVWHGTADQTVAPANMDAIVAQWAGVQGIALDSATTDRVDGQQRRRWTSPRGEPLIEAYSIAGLGHGTPIDPTAPDGCGAALPYMLPAGINSTQRIAETWGLADAARSKVEPVRAPPAPAPSGPAPSGPAPSARKIPRVAPPAVTKVIEDALRAAGLKR